MLKVLSLILSDFFCVIHLEPLITFKFMVTSCMKGWAGIHLFTVLSEEPSPLDLAPTSPWSCCVTSSAWGRAHPGSLTSMTSSEAVISICPILLII